MRASHRTVLALLPCLAISTCYEEGHSYGLPCTVDEGCDGNFECIEGFCLGPGESVLDQCGDGAQQKAEFCYPRDQRIAVKLPPVRDRFLAMGDFNGDGLPDFAGMTVDRKVFTSVYDGGSYTQTEVFQHPEVLKMYGLSVGDLDGDGNDDILVLTDGDDFRLQLNAYLGDGTGKGFDNVQSPAFAEGEKMPGAIGDFSGDGRPDVFTIDKMFGGRGHQINGTGGGNFAAAQDITAGSNPGDRLQAVDLQGDGVSDVIFMQRADELVTVLVSRPLTPAMTDWKLQRAIQLETESSPNDVIARDINDDGVADLVVSHEDSPTVLVFVGDFTREDVYVDRPERFEVPEANGAAIADLDGDGEVDLVAAGPSTGVFWPAWGFLDFGVAVEPGELRNVVRLHPTSLGNDEVPDLLVYERPEDNRFKLFIYPAVP